jgi:superfamily I DNA/RNA helicase
MNLYVKPAEWCPIDDLELESPGALDVVESTENCYVIAGPGTGKTELLAQRASYLLQTGNCPAPRRILSLSYMRDAKEAMVNRVRQRIGRELSARFVSMTYYGFAKGLVDHFLKALPREYRPGPDYEILLNLQQLYSEVNEITNFSLPTEDWVNKAFCVDIQPLPIKVNTSEDKMRKKIWQAMLRGDEQATSYLNFPMISALAEYLVRLNSHIGRAIDITYSHIFLDEFHDTTKAQYRLVKACFNTEDSILTAVGDHKQRIMEWAGADKEVFEKFEADFEAIEKNLLINHRSAPRLIAVQKSLSDKITSPSLEPKPEEGWSEEQGICEIWIFDKSDQEAERVSNSVKRWIREDKLRPRDICVLVRRQPHIYGKELIEKFNEEPSDISMRDENKYQGVLAEECSRIVLDIVSLAFGQEVSESSYETIRFLNLVKGAHSGIEDRNKLLRIEADFLGFLNRLRGSFSKVNDEKRLEEIFWSILDYLDVDLVANVFPQYRRGNYLQKQIKQLRYLLWQEYRKYNQWTRATKSLEGKFSVPIMTIHKSKGLEYDTVVFLGLEDSAFFKFSEQKREETCTFFVALSRAKRRVVLTFSLHRWDPQSDEYTKRNLKDTLPLYKALEQSSVLEFKDFRA